MVTKLPTWKIGLLGLCIPIQLGCYGRLIDSLKSVYALSAIFQPYHGGVMEGGKVNLLNGPCR